MAWKKSCLITSSCLSVSDMESEDKAEDGYFTLRFVLPRGKTEATCSEDLCEAVSVSFFVVYVGGG
jgi:hypothetical protein